MRTVYLNGEFVPAEAAKISIFDRGFIFGDGIYEVTAVLGGRLIDNELHMARLKRSLGELRIEAPMPIDNLPAMMRELVARNSLDEGLVYMQVTRGVHERDFAFPSGVTPTFVMFTQTRQIVDAPQGKTGMAVITVPDLRWSRRDIKSIAMIGQVLAKQAAREAEAGEAWLVEDGYVTEGASSTAFIVTEAGEIVTRVADHSILPGVTRLSVMALAAERDLEIVERRFTVEEAKAAKEAFVTSAGTFVTSVISIDGDKVGDGQPGPVVTRLRELYVAHARASGGAS